MKVIIAATLLGILMHAFAEECELMPPGDNFDLEKYFSIPHVYVTHSRNGPKEQVCREYKTTKNSDGTTTTLVTSDYKTGGKPYHSELKCTNTPKSGVKGQFSVECEVPNGNGGKKKIHVETSVIATDYKNYALLQSCTKTESGIADDVLLLQTKKEGVDPGVTSVLKSVNWSLDDWFSRSKVNCDNMK
uniref:Pallidipin n=1 Tax=Meccus pallidipennis TaxID=30077 RepID=PALL_MECPA|nr:RecName: Full=Pallidipin; AltName: Full=Pallidipin 2; Flags: Precursor [Meccus pallidipennis]AAA30329.1 pallidipin 2 [Meccus pallidipennis]